MNKTNIIILALLLTTILANRPNLSEEIPKLEEFEVGQPVVIGVPSEIVHNFHENLLRVKDKLDNFGQGMTSLALLSFYFRNLKTCIDDILTAYEGYCRTEGELIPSDSRILLGNK